MRLLRNCYETGLMQLSNLDPEKARRAIIRLESEHSHRRNWVWHSKGWSPLAKAIEHLARIANTVEAARQGTSLSEAITYYTESGWTADLALLDALASAEKSADIEAVESAVRTVYQPWLQDTVESFQKVVAASEPRRLPSCDPKRRAKRHLHPFHRWTEV